MEVLHTLPGGDLSPYKWFAPMAFSPDGATLAVGMPPLSPTPILLLDGHTLEPLPVQLSDLPTSGARVADITFSADGTTMASVIQTPGLGGRLLGRGGRGSAGVGPDGGGTPSLSMSRTSVCHRDFAYRCLVALSPVGDVVYTSTPLRAYDVASQKPTYPPAPDLYATGRPRRSNFFDLSPDGSLLAMAVEPDRLLLVDATTGQVRRVLHGHAEPVLAVRFSSDGTKLASSSADRTAHCVGRLHRRGSRAPATGRRGLPGAGLQPRRRDAVLRRIGSSGPRVGPWGPAPLRLDGGRAGP